jgi:hypothetical protein
VNDHIKMLRVLIASECGIILPGASNALTARVVADLGFKAVYLTGAGRRGCKGHRSNRIGRGWALFLTRPRLADRLQNAETIRQTATDIFSAMLEGSLSIQVSGRYGPDDVEHAHEELERRNTRGKPIIDCAPL